MRSNSERKIVFFSGHSCLWKVRLTPMIPNRLFSLPANYPNKWTVPLMHNKRDYPWNREFWSVLWGEVPLVLCEWDIKKWQRGHLLMSPGPLIPSSLLSAERSLSKRWQSLHFRKKTFQNKFRKELKENWNWIFTKVAK